MIEMNVNRASRCEEVVDMELYNNLLEKYNELSKENRDLKHRLFTCNMIGRAHV